MLKSRCRVTLAAQVQARQGIIRGAHICDPLHPGLSISMFRSSHSIDEAAPKPSVPGDIINTAH